MQAHASLDPLTHGFNQYMEPYYVSEGQQMQANHLMQPNHHIPYAPLEYVGVFNPAHF